MHTTTNAINSAQHPARLMSPTSSITPSSLTLRQHSPQNNFNDSDFRFVQVAAISAAEKEQTQADNSSTRFWTSLEGFSSGAKNDAEMLEQKNEENTVVEEATNTVTTTTTSTKALPVVDMSTALIAPPQSKEPKIVSALNVQAPEFTVAVGPTPAAATPRLTAVSIVPSIGTLNPAAKEFNFSVAPFTKSEGSVEEERKESALHANVEEFKCPKVASLVAAATATAADADAGAATLGASRYENVENEESKGEIVLAEDTIIKKINTGVVIDIVASSLSFCARATIKSTAHTSASPSIPTPAALKSTPAPLKNQENGHEGLFIRTFRVVANVLASAAAVGYVGCCYVRTAKPALRPKYVKWDAQGRRTPLDDDIVACKEYNDQEATETEAEEEEEVEKGQETNDAWSSGDAAVSFEKEMKKEEEEVEIPYAIACSSYHVDDEGSSDCESVVSLVAGVGAIAREEDGRSLGPHEEIKKEKEKKHEFSFCAIGKKEPVVEKRIEPFQVVAIGKAAADPEQPGILAFFVHIVAYLLCVIPLFALLKVDTAAKAVKQMRASTRQRVQKVTEAAVCARSKAISYLRTAVLVCIAAGSVVVIFSGVLIIKFLYHLQPKYFVALSVVAGAPALCAVIGGVAGAARCILVPLVRKQKAIYNKGQWAGKILHIKSFKKYIFMFVALAFVAAIVYALVGEYIVAGVPLMVLVTAQELQKTKRTSKKH